MFHCFTLRSSVLFEPGEVLTSVTAHKKSPHNMDYILKILNIDTPLQIRCLKLGCVVNRVSFIFPRNLVKNRFSCGEVVTPFEIQRYFLFKVERANKDQIDVRGVHT